MAVDFSKADLVICVGNKTVGGFFAEANGILSKTLSEEEWNSTVIPLITGVWHIEGIDNLDWFYYWKSVHDGDGLQTETFYLTEKTDLTEDIPKNYNETPKSGGPSVEEAKLVYNALVPTLNTVLAEWREQQAALAAMVGEQSQWLPRTDIPVNMSTLKYSRDQRLIACDWTQLPDSPISDELKAAYATYRQELRDLPSLQTDPYDPSQFTGWPTEPR